MENSSRAMFEDAEKVYELLSDEESKAIFWDRLKYSITGNKEYLLDAVIDGYTFNSTFANESNVKLAELLKKIIVNHEECEIAVFGASDNAMTIVELLYEFGLLDDSMPNVNCYYVDNDAKKWGSDFGWHNPLMHMEVYNPEILKNRNKNVYVLLAVRTYSNDMRLTRQLLGYGIKETDIYHDLIAYEYFLGEMYLAEGIMKPVDGDVLCDVGTFDLYNTEKFIKWNPKFEHVYAFEADPVSFKKCKNRDLGNKVEVFNLGVWSCKSQLNFESAPNGEYGGSRINTAGKQTVDTISLDEFLNGKRTSIIKMDIEGAELEALKGAKETIKKFKPCLTLSIYHKPEDICTLPLYVHSLNPDYKFYLRHHIDIISLFITD
jgi:FkbM family methyltransferase